MIKPICVSRKSSFKILQYVILKTFVRNLLHIENNQILNSILFSARDSSPSNKDHFFLTCIGQDVTFLRRSYLLSSSHKNSNR